MFSNLPDRKSGQGLIEDILIEEYMKENPNVKIQVEALYEEAYKVKFMAYCMEKFPDIVSIWGEPSFLQEAMEANLLLELNEKDFSDYGFIPGSLDGFKYNGKLFGLPRNTDVAVVYCNDRVFYDNKWKIPSSLNELLENVNDMNEANIVPLAIDGADGWPLMMFVSDILHHLAGEEYNSILDKAYAEKDFSNPYLIKALKIFKDCVDAGLFQSSFAWDDYGTAQSLFVTEKAAFYYMGSWDLAMCKMPGLYDHVKSNFRIITLPYIEGGKKHSDELFAWYGGGYGISASSKYKEEALKFYKYMFRSENIVRLGIEKCIGLSAQDGKKYITGNEPVALLELVDIVDNAKTISGVPLNDKWTRNFKISVERNIQRYATGSISLEEFISLMEAECGN